MRRKGLHAFLSQNTQRKKWSLVQSFMTQVCFTKAVCSAGTRVSGELMDRSPSHACDPVRFGKARNSHFGVCSILECEAEQGTFALFCLQHVPEKMTRRFGKNEWGREDLDLGRTKIQMLNIYSVDKKHQ